MTTASFPEHSTGADWQRAYDPKSVKWNFYDRDVIPMWVADMDMPVAPVIAEAVARRVQDSRVAYPVRGRTPLVEAVLARLAKRHGLAGLEHDHAIFLSCVPGLHATARALTTPGEAIVVQTPLYGPFLDAIATARVTRQDNPLVRGADHQYEIDFDHLEATVTPATRVLMFCNPHNPTGRVWRRTELEKVADFVLRHRLWLVTDELHNELVHDGPYIPFASISPEIAQRTITLTGPAKTFNTAGLSIGIMVSHNRQLLDRVRAVTHGLVQEYPNVAAEAAWLAAITTPEADAWHHDTLGMIGANRDRLTRFLADHAPAVGYAPSQGTYLGWLDVRAYPWAEHPADYLKAHAKVGLSDGTSYGPAGAGHVRLNYATYPDILEEALARLAPHLAL